MKKLLLLSVYILLVCGLSFCKKSENPVAVSKVSSPIDTMLSLPATTGFTPYIDTFSGICYTSIDDVDDLLYDTTVISEMFVAHVAVDSVMITGNIITIAFFHVGVSPTYGTGTISYNLPTDSTGSVTYTQNPVRHDYNRVHLYGDSLTISESSEPGSCFANQTESFSGKKIH